MVHKNEYEVEPSAESVGQTAAGVTEQAEELVRSIGQTVDSAAQTIQIGRAHV